MLGNEKLFFDASLRLSEAPVFFRASGDNFLRSITRAIVNKNIGKCKIDFLTLFWDFQRLSFFFAPPGITFCDLSPGLYLTKILGNVKFCLGSFWHHFGIILGSFWDHVGIILRSFWNHFRVMLESF